jgi:sigma-B regulation protein RsbU (phosphoserine phosphatase)
MGVGIDDGDTFERVTKDTTITLESGDLMLLYTDGVDEALDAEGAEFGVERIRSLLAKVAPQGAKAVVDQLMEALNEFVGGKASNDDVTLIALQKA